MTTIKQRYTIIIHASVDESISAESRHAKFFDQIRDLPPPWTSGDRPPPRFPKLEFHAADVIGVKKFWSVPGIKIAELSYVTRRKLTDDGYCDDGLVIDFNPIQLDYRLLIDTVLPRFIEAFDAYRAECYDEAFIEAAYEERKVEGGTLYTPRVKEYVNPRYQVRQAWPICYFGERLCRRAFDLTPSEILTRVKPVVETARLLHDGVYIVGSSEVLPFERAQTLARQIYEAILGKPPRKDRP
jgi:hypothetical protein